MNLDLAQIKNDLEETINDIVAIIEIDEVYTLEPVLKVLKNKLLEFFKGKYGDQYNVWANTVTLKDVDPTSIVSSLAEKVETNEKKDACEEFKEQLEKLRSLTDTSSSYNDTEEDVDMEDFAYNFESAGLEFLEEVFDDE